MGVPARALMVATLAAARPVTDVARCKNNVLRHLAAAGNIEDEQWATLVCAPEHLPPTLAQLAVAAPDKLPAGYARACAGSFVATRLVYGEGITHVEALGKDPSRLAAAATTYVGAQRDVSQLQEKVLASQDLDDATKRLVADLLRPSLS